MAGVEKGMTGIGTALTTKTPDGQNTAMTGSVANTSKNNNPAVTPNNPAGTGSSSNATGSNGGSETPAPKSTPNDSDIIV